MNRTALGLCAVAWLAGCPSDATNGAVLYLAPDGSELRVRLIEEPPPPY